MTTTLVPAAQYLRMSTDSQQYSLENQSAAIEHYAEAHNFTIIRTYSDPAKTDLILRNRPGLQQLLQDVVSRTPNYRAILVYDVSRWVAFRIRMRPHTTNSFANPLAYLCIIAPRPSPTIPVCRAC